MGKQRISQVDRSIPYAQRLMMQKAQTWHDEREDAVKVAMYHICIVLNRQLGFGYNRLTLVSQEMMKACKELYASNTIDVEVSNLRKAIEQLGIDATTWSLKSNATYYPTGETEYAKELDSKRHAEITAQREEASDIAVAMMIIKLNRNYGIGKDRLERLGAEVQKRLKDYYASDTPDVEWKNLCDAMVQLGFFRTSTGKVMAWIDENGNPVRVKGGKDGLIRATG